MSLSLLSVNNDIYNICFFISLLPFPWEYHTWSSNPNLIPLSSTYLYSNLSTSSSRLYTFSSIHPITSISTLYLTYMVLGQELLLLVLSKLHSLSQKLNRLLNRLDLLQALYLALDLDLDLG